MNNRQAQQRVNDILLDSQSEGLLAIAILLALIAIALFVYPTHDILFTSILDRIGFLIVGLIFLIWRTRLRYPLGTWVTGLGITLAIFVTNWLQPEWNLSSALVIPCMLIAGYISTRSGIVYGICCSIALIIGNIYIMGAPTQDLVNSIAVIGGSLAGVWVILRPYRTITHESWIYYNQAKELLEKYRDNQMELAQANSELQQAYTELTRLNKLVVTSQKIAEEARQAKESFVANVSHELRTPLNMIIGFSDMISRSPQTYHKKLPAELLADISAVRRNAEHLSRLVDDVLDLSKLDSGYFHLNPSFCSIRELVISAVEGVRTLFETKGLYLQMEFSDSLPQVLCDETRIRQVLLNLLSNAGRFVEQGGVTINAVQEMNRVIIGVSDTGPGISEDEQKQLFEPFHQLAKPYQTQKGGTGLGLSISKKLVELHGGQIWLQSQLNQGTTFFFSLPLVSGIVQEAGIQRWLSPYTQFSEKDRKHRKKIIQGIKNSILMIDPESRLSKLAARFWADIDVELAANLEEARERMKAAPPQALVINRPLGLNEEDVRTFMINLPYNIPVILCDAKEPQLISERYGVSRFLIKPVTREHLLEAIEAIPHEIRKILVVDDEAECLQLFTRMLSTAEKKYQLLRAENGERALSIIRRNHPDLVLLDIMMPGINGLELLAILRQDPEYENMAIIITSAQDPHNEPLSSSHVTVLNKDGFSGKLLLETISNLIQTPAERSS